MTDPDWLAKIVVTEHALERAEGRLGQPISRETVRVDIRLAVLCGRTSTTKPGWLRSHGYHPRRYVGVAYPDQFFAWNEDASRCWVVGASATGRTLVVRTIILSDRDLHRRAERDRLRVGLR